MKDFKNLPCWKKVLAKELQKPYIKNIKCFINQPLISTKTYPKINDIFQAFELTPFSMVKVIILGQDPYHGEGQAHGLSFSVSKEMSFPPSLSNIFKEMKEDLDLNTPTNGYLKPWAEQGVFLLNSVLTVEKSKPGSHQKLGWQNFTDFVIKELSQKKENLVFILWGNYAQKKIKLIDDTKHLILKSAHPSPLSAYRGFFGSKPFSKTNEYLRTHSIEEINWALD